MAKMTPAEFRESQEPNQSSNQSTVNSAYEKAKAEFYALRKASKSSTGENVLPPNGTDENGLPPDDPDCDFQNCL